MNSRAIEITAKVLAGIVCGSVAVFSAGLSAGVGAKVGGLDEGGWNWQFLLPVYLGWLVGFLVTIGVSFFVFSRNMSWYLQLGAVLSIAPLTTFALSVSYHFVTSFAG